MQSKPATRSSVAFTAVRGWVLLSAFLSLLGWTLALSGQLHAWGYLAGFLVGGVLLALWVRREVIRGNLRFSPRPGWRRRWRRPLPLVFVALFALVAAGAALHPPNNYDALTYRLPQILHWLAEGRWHWIPVSEGLMNISPPGYGWWMAPMIVFLKTDRLFALPNLVAFALLPGLFFSVLRQCGVRRRVAWSWMWIVPSASCFAMQAGGIGNDLLPAVYALAALALGMRAARGGDIRDFWLSGLAAALLTGVKVTAAPLILPWLVATLPCWRLAQKRWIRTAAAIGVALVISYLPTAIANTRYAGSWNGDPTDKYKVQVHSPLHAVAGNSLMILTGALEPPVCPILHAAKAKFDTFEESDVGKWIRTMFPRFELRWGELATEEASGLGLGVFALAMLSFGLAWRRGSEVRRTGPDWGRWVGLASLIAIGAYLAKMGSESAPRLAAPYYPFLLIPLLRAGRQDWLTRRRWGQVLAVLAALSVVPAVILTPARPLWPAQSVLAQLAAKKPDSVAIARAKLVYTVYAQRHDDVAPLKPFFPSDGRPIGYVRAENDIEAPLWKPYGSRRVVELLPPKPKITGLKKSVVIGASAAFGHQFGLTPEAFAQSVGGHIAGKASLQLKASAGPQEWVVIQLP